MLPKCGFKLIDPDWNRNRTGFIIIIRSCCSSIGAQDFLSEPTLLGISHFLRLVVTVLDLFVVIPFRCRSQFHSLVTCHDEGGKHYRITKFGDHAIKCINWLREMAFGAQIPSYPF